MVMLEKMMAVTLVAATAASVLGCTGDVAEHADETSDANERPPAVAADEAPDLAERIQVDRVKPQARPDGCGEFLCGNNHNRRLMRLG